MGKHEAEVQDTMTKLEQTEYRLNPKKCEFFKLKIEWVWHKMDQQEIRPLQDKLEAITEISISWRKRIKVILGRNAILIKIHGKSVDKYRHSEKTAEETKRTDVDRWTHQSV